MSIPDDTAVSGKAYFKKSLLTSKIYLTPKVAGKNFPEVDYRIKIYMLEVCWHMLMRSTPWRMWGKPSHAWGWGGGKVKLCAITTKASVDPTGSQGAGMTS